MRSLLVAAALSLLSPAIARAEWWVVVSYVDHEPFAWTDAIMDRANYLERTLRPCGLGVWWEWVGKFRGFNPNKRGTVFVIDTGLGTSKSQAQRVLNLTKACIPDAYIKEGYYLGE